MALQFAEISLLSLLHSIARGVRESLARRLALLRTYCTRPPTGFSMPWVTIKTGLTGPDGREEELREYLCDHPGCPNIATHVLGCIAELRVLASVCEEHVPRRLP